MTYCVYLQRLLLEKETEYNFVFNYLHDRFHPSVASWPCTTWHLRQSLMLLAAAVLVAHVIVALVWLPTNWLTVWF